MAWKNTLARFSGWLKPDRRRDLELQEELRSHIELETEENIARGMSPDEARRVALVKFGNVERAHDKSLDMWSFPTVESLSQDLRFGWRVLWKNPRWAAVAILTLALGIGASSAVFSVVNALILRSLPYPDADRLVYIWSKDGTRVPKAQSSYPNYLDWQEQAKSFSEIGAWYGSSVTISGNGEPRYLPSQRASASFFRVLGVQPQLGRTFIADEERYGNNHVIILSDELWRSMYASDPKIIGRTIQVNSTPYEVIGVMPKSFFALYREARAWVPLSFSPENMPDRGTGFLHVIGRIRPGVSVAKAQAEIYGLSEELAKQFPDNRGQTAFLVPMQTELTEKLRPAMWAICGAVAFVFLVVCANVANLLAARSASRTREMAIRASIGGTRARILTQLVTENALIALLGCGGGIIAAFVFLSLFSRVAADYLPPVRAIALDWATLLFAVGSAFVSIAIFGIFPAVQGSHANLQSTLKQDSPASSAPQGRMKTALIVVEVAISVLLLSSAGLLIGSVHHMLRVDVGFEPRDAVAAHIVLPYARYPKDEDRTTFFSQFLSDLEADPHVRAAGASNTLPLSTGGDRYWTMLIRPGWESMDPGAIPSIAWFQVTPDYFRAIGAPLRAGRDFTPQDDMKHPLVTIVSENLAAKYFSGEDAVGKQIRFGTNPDDQWLTIVGLVSSAPVDSLADELPPAAYTPYFQGYHGVAGDMTVVVRSADPQVAMDLVRAKLHQANPNVAVASSSTLEQVIADSVRTPRTLGRLFTAFAFVAVLLSAVGLFGVLSYAVSQRQREIGIRMALGANRASVMRMVMSESGVLVVAGCVLGVIGSIAAATEVRSLLFGVKPTDPVPLLVGSLGVAMVAVLAAALPARRAMQVDPTQALRDQ